MNINLDCDYWVIRRGGSLGELSSSTYPKYVSSSIVGRVVYTTVDKFTAKQYAGKQRKALTIADKRYYNMGYNVVVRDISKII